MRERLDAARKAETARIEERKNSHIERLMKAHEKAFAEIKNYYNDITHNNLDLIRSLKEEVRVPSARARALLNLFRDPLQPYAFPLYVHTYIGPYLYDFWLGRRARTGIGATRGPGETVRHTPGFPHESIRLNLMWVFGLAPCATYPAGCGHAKTGAAG